jgi:hypothetical protein
MSKENSTEDDFRAMRSIITVFNKHWQTLSPAARAYLKVKVMEIVNESPK